MGRSLSSTFPTLFSLPDLLLLLLCEALEALVDAPFLPGAAQQCALSVKFSALVLRVMV